MKIYARESASIRGQVRRPGQHRGVCQRKPLPVYNKL